MTRAQRPYNIGKGNRKQRHKSNEQASRINDLDQSVSGRDIESPMPEKWQEHRPPRDPNGLGRAGFRGRGRFHHSQSHPAHHGRREFSAASGSHRPGGGRGRGREAYSPRTSRKREFTPDRDRRPPHPRRPSVSPARSQRDSSRRRRYADESAYDSRESSPVRYSKRRRTRSPSQSSWSDRGDSRRRYSRSRSRERYSSRDRRPESRRGGAPALNSGPAPNISSRRGSPLPARSSAAHAREPEREPDVDTYIPERRRLHTPPKQYRSPSPRRRSASPTYKRRSLSPVARYPSRQDSPASRYDSPPPSRMARPRDDSPASYSRRRSYSRSLSPAPASDKDRARNRPRESDRGRNRDRNRDAVDGPFPTRGNHHNSSFNPRARGQRGFGSRGGAFRGSSKATSPTSSHHGSPPSQPHASYHNGRGGFDPPSSHNQQRQSGPPYRNNTYHAPTSQDEYFRSQQQNHNHPYPNQPSRPYRGRGGFQRGGGYHQDRFGNNNHDSADGPPVAPRGRGGLYTNVQWTPNGTRGGGLTQPGTGPNSIRASPVTSNEPRDAQGAAVTAPSPAQSATQTQEDRPFQPPRAPHAQQNRDRHVVESPSTRPESEAPRNGKDTSKFSFALKSKIPSQSPVKPAAELSLQTKEPPTRPALDRPPPTQPRGNRFHDKRSHQNNSFHDRRQHDFDAARPPPKGPAQQSHTHNHSNSRPVPTSPRTRSRSPPPKKIKQELPITPTLTPEQAASESVYFRKPGNESVVGAGTYGKVFKATHIFTKDGVALKKIRMEGERDGFPITAVREIKLLQVLRHKHVVALQEVMVEKNECFMVFEYMSHDMTGLINHPTFRLSEAHKKDLGRQMFEGLEFLHRRGVMHRDIKAANLLISSTGQLKYADFGLARFYTKSRRLDYTNRVITIWYRPPELLLGETQYTPAVDIWSAACVFMEMFTRKAIFPGEGGEISQLEKIYNVLGTPTPQVWPAITELPWYELMQPVIGGVRKRVFETQFGDILSPMALDLVRNIFSFDPAQRPDAFEILRHEYFTTEEPRPQRAWELEQVGGDWHEYESKAHRRENERKEKERRKEEHAKEKERRKREETEGKVDEVPAAPLPIGEEEVSDGEGSARMSMS